MSVVCMCVTLVQIYMQNHKSPMSVECMCVTFVQLYMQNHTIAMSVVCMCVTFVQLYMQNHTSAMSVVCMCVHFMCFSTLHRPNGYVLCVSLFLCLYAAVLALPFCPVVCVTHTHTHK
jgi:hypothetical protein